MVNNNVYGYSIILIQTFVEILLDEKMSDNLKELRIDGLKTLSGYLEFYKKRGYVGKLVDNIAEKKIKMLMQIESKKEMDKMLKPSPPHFNGAKFVTDEYNVIEEELICWSETSLRAPLNEEGYKRYLELFNIVFPEYKDKLNT